MRALQLVTFLSAVIVLSSNSAANDQSILTLRGHEGWILHGHTEDVTSVAFSPDGRHFASGSDDKSVRIWSAGNGEELAVFRGHEDSVTSVAFSPDGRSVVSAGGVVLKLWNCRNK